MLDKSTFVIQPYYVGQKDRKSLAAIIPSKIVKKYNIDSSTIFTVRIDQQTNSIMLQIVDPQLPYKKNMITTTTPTGESLEDSSQQVLSRAQ